MIVGTIMMGFRSVSSFILKKEYSLQPKLNLTTEGCPALIWEGFRNVTINNSTLLPASQL